MTVYMGTALIADNVKFVGVRRGRPCICFKQNLWECSSFLKSAGFIDDHNSIPYNALGMTTVLKTLIEIDGLNGNGDKPLCRNTTHRTYKVK